MSHARKWGVASALVLLAAMAGASVLSTLQDDSRSGNGSSQGGALSTLAASLGWNSGTDGGAAVPAAQSAGGSDQPGTYIVVFREPALGTYDGEVAGLPAPQQRRNARGKLRMDVRGAEARNYVSWLRGRQAQHEQRMAAVAGRQPAVRLSMQHAINGLVADLSPAEAGRIARLPEVMLVEPYREYPLQTDVGPALIGAEPVWSGANLGAAAGFQGEGIVFGIIDSGINFGSPSFAAVDPIDGYVHANPLGAGNYLGTCAPGEVDAGRCNDKLFGGYDFVCGAPANRCGVANIREEPGFGDTSGHGSHTASTAAGNRRDAEYRGNTVRISGVAPRGNIVAFDICYTNTSTGQGLCPNVSAVAAIDQALADGVVDVFNYSIGGGSQPWEEAVSLAFLGATNAGIYVAASAGNSGPGPNTMGHLEPWVASTAAAQHGRGTFSTLLQVTGPSPVPEDLTAVVLNEGVNGVPHTQSLPGPLRVSPGIDSADDGCSAFPAATFEDAIAVVRRGACSFSIKANNATAAGAIAVVIANNAAGAVTPSVPGTSVPVFGALQADGDALRDFHSANPSATALIGYPATPLPNTADALAAFSSRGPAGSFNLVKPDVTAPGVQVLAAYAGTTISGFEDLVSAINGTSMASPHQAGAAGLLRQARPGWTVPEIKSALMMTATPGVWLEDEVTPADPFARGAGRIRVDLAMNAGLVLHETGANYLAADPATGGDPAALNQPSMADRSCFESCTFTRTFRNTLSYPQSWVPSLQGLAGSVWPRLVQAGPGQSVTVQVTVDTTGLAADGNWHFGTLVLDPPGGRQKVPFASQHLPLPTLRLPVGVAVQPPQVEIPSSVTASVAAGGNGSGATGIGNVGGSTLAFAVDNTGYATLPVYGASRGGVNSGFRSTFYTDAGVGQFASDDFTLAVETRVTTLFAEGFVISGAALSSVAGSLTWSIFPDAGGQPAGNPETSPGAAVWSYTASPNSAGVSTTGNAIGLDLLAAGQDLVLPPGRYWFVPHASATFANRWAWFGSDEGDGSFRTITPSSGNWATSTAFAGLSMKIDGQVACGAPWLGAFDPGTGTVAPGASQPVTFAVHAAGLAPGSYTGHYCVSSNDPRNPKVGGRISLQVN